MYRDGGDAEGRIQSPRAKLQLVAVYNVVACTADKVNQHLCGAHQNFSRLRRRQPPHSGQLPEPVVIVPAIGVEQLYPRHVTDHQSLVVVAVRYLQTRWGNLRILSATQTAELWRGYPSCTHGSKHRERRDMSMCANRRTEGGAFAPMRRCSRGMCALGYHTGVCWLCYVCLCGYARAL